MAPASWSRMGAARHTRSKQRASRRRWPRTVLVGSAILAGAGFAAAVPLDQILSPTGLSLLPELEKGCFSYLEKTLDKHT
jgi:hypothetical protein